MACYLQCVKSFSFFGYAILLSKTGSFSAELQYKSKKTVGSLVQALFTPLDDLKEKSGYWIHKINVIRRGIREGSDDCSIKACDAHRRSYFPVSSPIIILIWLTISKSRKNQHCCSKNNLFASFSFTWCNTSRRRKRFLESVTLYEIIRRHDTGDKDHALG